MLMNEKIDVEWMLEVWKRKTETENGKLISETETETGKLKRRTET